LKFRSFAPTLAHKLGDVPHVSGLLRRIAQLSGAGRLAFRARGHPKLPASERLIFPKQTYCTGGGMGVIHLLSVSGWIEKLRRLAQRKSRFLTN